MQEEQIHDVLNKHRQASAAGDANAAHDIYDDDAICDYPQSGRTNPRGGRPVYTVSIMEFLNGKVVHETQYFADPFEAPVWRSQWVQRITRRCIEWRLK